MKPLFKKRVGYQEKVRVSFDGNNWFDLTATMDTGNSGIFPTMGVFILDEDEEKIRFSVQASYYKTYKEVTCDIEGTIKPKVGKEKVTRPVVKVAYITVGGRTLRDTYVAVADRSFKKTQSLMNRNLMKELKLIVDPGIKH